MFDDNETHAIVRFFIIMNEDGDYVVHEDIDAANENFSDNYGGYARETTIVNLKVKKPKPIEREVSGELPDSATGAEVKLTLTETK